MSHPRGSNIMGQEIDEMLANSLTLEDEEAVQAELRELQLETVSSISSWLATSLIGHSEARCQGLGASGHIAFCTTGGTRFQRYVYWRY